MARRIGFDNGRFTQGAWENVHGESWYRKRHGALEPAPIGSPDAHLDALTRSIRILEAWEVSLPHVRYRFIQNTETSLDVPEARQDDVEVTRYNLGPALRDERLSRNS